MNKNFNSIAGHVSAVFTVCVWGTTFIATKLLLNYFTAVEIMFYRFLIAFILLFLMCPKILKYRNIKEEIIFASAGLLGISLYQLCENSALMFTYASNVSFITTVAPFFTAVFLKLRKPAGNFIWDLQSRCRECFLYLSAARRILI